MEPFTIRLIELDELGDCPLCGHAQQEGKGLRLFAKDHRAPLCRDCGKKAAPSLSALLNLAQTAERVGRSCRPLLTPPMESLLDLARAAEDYTGTLP
jgi:hypothetical protein